MGPTRSLLLAVRAFLILGSPAVLAAPTPPQPEDPLTARAEPRWFKGNLHTHSLWSDGNDYPEMIVDWYARHGYQFLARCIRRDSCYYYCCRHGGGLMLNISDRAAESQDKQGWTDETVGELALEFIRSLGREKEFERYLERVATEENGLGTEDEGTEDS